MTYETGSFDAAIAAAAGADAALYAELRAGFAQSVEVQLGLLRRSRCDGNWRLAAERLHGLGASFHAGDLVSLAQEALDGAPGDPVVLRRIEAFLTDFAAQA